MKKWVAFSSSSGETFENVWRSLSAEVQANCLGFFCDRDCLALERAKKIFPTDKVYQFSKSEFESKTLEVFEKLLVDRSDTLIFLCGFFGILSEQFIKSVDVPIVNTHPSLLPAYAGMDKKVNELAFFNNPISGFSVHLVTEVLDGGPILFQKAVDISQARTADESRALVRALEQKELPAILERILRSSVKANDRHRKARELYPLL